MTALDDLHALWAELQLTTKGYTQLRQPLPAGHWKNAQAIYDRLAAELAAPAPSRVYGLFGSYAGVPLDPSQPGSAYSHGVRELVYEFHWADREKTEGAVDFTGDVATINQWRAWGYRVTLSYGIHVPPAWFMALDGARFVDQHGTLFTTATGGADGQDVPNLVFARDHVPAGKTLSLGQYAARYLQACLAALQAGLKCGLDDIDMVRVGGGHFGELALPNHYAENNWWCYDVHAKQSMAAAGVPQGWLPGGAAAGAAPFRSWVQRRMADFQNWQIMVARDGGYQGIVAVLYPDFGADKVAMDAAQSGSFGGATSPERNGEVQRGYWHDHLIANLADPLGDPSKVCCWHTAYTDWAGAPAAAVASAAVARGFLHGGENSEGHDSKGDMAAFGSQARTLGAARVAWIRAQELYRITAPASGAACATVADYAAEIAKG